MNKLAVKRRPELKAKSMVTRLLAMLYASQHPAFLNTNIGSSPAQQSPFPQDMRYLPFFRGKTRVATVLIYYRPTHNCADFFAPGGFPPSYPFGSHSGSHFLPIAKSFLGVKRK